MTYITAPVYSLKTKGEDENKLIDSWIRFKFTNHLHTMEFEQKVTYLSIPPENDIEVLPVNPIDLQEKSYPVSELLKFTGKIEQIKLIAIGFGNENVNVMNDKDYPEL
jgi:hypothetical protein